MEASSRASTVGLYPEYFASALVNVTARLILLYNDGADVLSLVLQVVHISFGVLGLLGNLFVVIVIVGFTKMHKKFTNMYVVNQSIIDGISSLILIAQMLSHNVKVTLTAHQPLSEIYCRAWSSQGLLWGCYTASIYNIVVLTIERYLKIVHPVFHKVFFTLRKAKALLTFVWLFGISFQYAYLAPTATVINNRCLPLVNWPNISTRDLVGYVTFMVQYFLPVLIFITAYWKMLRALKRVDATGNEGISQKFFNVNS